MQFPVPQFIEKEASIIGPLTFKQFLFLGGGGAICFLLYFSFGQTNLFLFILLAICIMGTAAALAFLKFSGQSLPNIIANFFHFSAGPRMYIWKRKGGLQTPIQKSPIVFKKAGENSLKTEKKTN